MELQNLILDLASDIKDKHLSVLGPIGSGGFATVYKGGWPVHGWRVVGNGGQAHRVFVLLAYISDWQQSVRRFEGKYAQAAAPTV